MFYTNTWEKRQVAKHTDMTIICMVIRPAEDSEAPTNLGHIFCGLWTGLKRLTALVRFARLTIRRRTRRRPGEEQENLGSKNQAKNRLRAGMVLNPKPAMMVPPNQKIPQNEFGSGNPYYAGGEGSKPQTLYDARRTWIYRSILCGRGRF